MTIGVKSCVIAKILEFFMAGRKNISNNQSEDGHMELGMIGLGRMGTSIEMLSRHSSKKARLDRLRLKTSPGCLKCLVPFG